MSNSAPEIDTTTLSETENMTAWKADEPDGETTFHLQLNNVTVHFYQEEWDEFISLAEGLVK
jgi:hypothetical protein